MNEKELEKELKRIQRIIERKQIIEKAMTVAEQHGTKKSETHPYHFKSEEKFHGKDYEGKDFWIEHTSGWSDFGGEDIKIFYERQIVFYADTVANRQDIYTPKYNPNLVVPTIKIGELYVHQYTPGDWEKQLALIYRKGPKKEKVVVEKQADREVEQSKLEELAARLPIKI